MVNIFNRSHYKLEQVVRCSLQHAASVAKTFLTSDVVVADIKELEAIPMRKKISHPSTLIPSSGTSSHFIIHALIHYTCKWWMHRHMYYIYIFNYINIWMLLYSWGTGIAPLIYMCLYHVIVNYLSAILYILNNVIF